jgi:DNA-binding SARP family transcriptional activator
MLANAIAAYKRLKRLTDEYAGVAPSRDTADGKLEDARTRALVTRCQG